MSEHLKDFLASAQRPEGTMDYHELCGFLFSVVCSPELVVPSEWLPFVFGGQKPGFADSEQAKNIIQQLFELYNEIDFQVQEGNVSLPAGCQPAERAMDNFDGPLGRWSRGFLEGHNWLGEVWDSCLPEEVEDELGDCLIVMSYFADPDLAAACLENLPGEERDEEHMAQDVAGVFSEAMAGYALVGSTLYRMLSGTPSVQQPYVKDAPEPGRNDPCPCGSGKKYKHCCLH